MQVFQRIAKPFREVALRKESVDRNIDTSKDAIKATSRSPQGERG